MSKETYNGISTGRSLVRRGTPENYSITHGSKRLGFWESLPVRPTPGYLIATAAVSILATVLVIVDRWDEASNKARVLEWSEQTSDRLEASIIATSSTEKFYPTVVVVPVGLRSFEERVDMALKGTPVNVRNYPALAGRGNEVVGTVAQGARIHNVLKLGNWGIFYCDSVEESGWVGGKPAIEPGRVCAMDISYQLAVSQTPTIGSIQPIELSQPEASK